MDIFCGSNRPLQISLLDRASSIIGGLDENYVRSDKGRISIWQHSLYNGEVIYFLNDDFEILFDGYLNNLTTSLIDYLPILAKRIIKGQNILCREETGIFNLVVIDRKTKDIFLASDPSALLPFYYLQENDSFYFFSHMYIFAETFNLKPDLIGILEKLKFTYTIGSRTIYESLHRLNPGEIICFDQGLQRIKIKQSEVYYTKYEEYGKDLIDATWAVLNKPFQAYHSSVNGIGVMLSEGFDSRLMAGVANLNGYRISAFTHGTPGTIGNRITFDVAMAVNAEYHLDPLANGLPTGDKQLRRQLFISDNLSLPYWEDGSQYFFLQNIPHITTGYALDSTLGGHCFFRANSKKTLAIIQRYSEIIKQDCKLINSNYVEKLSSEIIENLRTSCTPDDMYRVLGFYFSSAFQETLLQVIDSIATDFGQEIIRMKNTGSDLPSEQLQRFFLEQRGRKFSFGQELMIRQRNKVIIPSYEPATMRVLSSIHPKYRLQHQLYLQLLNQKLPNLIAIPNGGYGMAADRPRLLLETSRFMHKFNERAIINRFLKQRGNSDISKMRTANCIELIYRKEKTLDYFQDFLIRHKELFNESALNKQIDQIRNYESKSYLIMELYRLVEILDPLYSM